MRFLPSYLWHYVVIYGTVLYLKKRIIHYKMLRRITIMLDDDLQKKLRDRQAKLIKQGNKSVSFSQVINQTLSEAVKKSKK